MRKPRGVSLIEFIIYVGLASLILVGMGLFTADLLQSRSKVNTIDKNKQSSRQALDRLSREIEKGTGLNVGSSTFNSSPGVLSIQRTDVSLNPTVFDVSGGRLRMTQGANPAVFLTATNETVTNLVFTNLSSGSVYLVRVQMTITTDLAGGQTEFKATDSYTSSVLLHN